MTPAGALPHTESPFRFSMATYQWGDRTRFGIMDGRTGNVRAVRSSRVAAEDELINLNLNEGASVVAAAAPMASTATSTAAHRICGRCRRSFTLGGDGDPVARGDWWLCDPCRESLMGPLSERRGGKSAEVVPATTAVRQ